jgi:large subunit ribosomal protein L17
MRHRLAGRQLSRTTSHRVALFRNLSRSLITHESIKTTTPKAKSLRPFKIKALHFRRQAIMHLGPMHGTGVYTKEGDLAEKGTETVLKKLFNVIGPRFKTRPGGYTRILKLHTRRLGDAGEQSIIEFMKEGEEKVGGSTKKEAAPAPALAVEG